MTVAQYILTYKLVAQKEKKNLMILVFFFLKHKEVMRDVKFTIMY